MEDELIKEGIKTLGTLALKSGASEAGKSIVTGFGAQIKSTFQKFFSKKDEAALKANERATNFLNQTLGTIKKIDEKGAEVEKSKVEESLADPDFQITLAKAIESSMKKDDSESHDLLGRLISQRLLSKSDDLVSLTSQLAVDAIGKLSRKQMLNLALATKMLAVAPINLPTFDNDAQKEDWCKKWWQEQLDFCFSVPKLNNIEVQHLDANGCWRLMTVTTNNLTKVLQREIGAWNTQEFLQHDPKGKFIDELWPVYLNKIRLTNVGMLIGTHVSDQITQSVTMIDW